MHTLGRRLSVHFGPPDDRSGARASECFAIAIHLLLISLYLSVLLSLRNNAHITNSNQFDTATLTGSR